MRKYKGKVVRDGMGNYILTPKKNELQGDVSFESVTDGNYKIASEGKFTLGDTLLSFQIIQSQGVPMVIHHIDHQSNSLITFQTVRTSNEIADFIDEIHFSIEVYTTP